VIQNDELFVSPSTMVLGDGTDRATAVMPAMIANDSFIIPPFWTDSLLYFNILSTTPQENTVDVQLYLQPIYQVAG
jgi:hypothetical protein